MNAPAQVKYQVWLLIVAVFALGSITGGALDRLYLSRTNALRQPRGGERGPGRMLEQMKTDLNLTEAQTQSIKQLFDDKNRRDEFRQVMGSCAGIKEMRQKHDNQIRALLTPEQVKRFDELKVEREKKHNSPPPAPPAP
jgi:Spy/CpxP family protein refolding chaperone